VSKSLRTVSQAIEEAAKSTGAGYRFIQESSNAEPFFTFSGVERVSARFGAAMQALGLRKGDRVALVVPDNQDFVFSFLGALRAGLVPVPIFPPTGLRRLGVYLENTLHIVNKSGAKMVLADAAIKRLLGTVQQNAQQLDSVVSVQSLRTMREELTPVKLDLDDTCFLQFTSGSTSAPKGVVVSYGNVAHNVDAFLHQGLRVEAGVDSGVCWLPLYHDMGLVGFVLAPLFSGNTVTFLQPLSFLRRPVRWLQAISRHRASISFGPNFAYALCCKRVRDKDIEGLDLSSWRVAGCGAEPIRAGNLEDFGAKFSPIGFNPRAFLPGYGMAEATLAVSLVSLGAGAKTDVVDGDKLAEGQAVVVPADTAHRVEVVSCGSGFDGHDVAVFDPDDGDSSAPLSDRCVGELRVRGPSVSAGYFNEPALSDAARAGGWLRTGDLGYLVDGEVYVCGRIKELIIVNGRNYYPQDLEWEASKVGGVRRDHVIAFGTRPPLSDRERVVIVFEATQQQQGHDAVKSEVRQRVRQASGLSIDDVVAVQAGVLPKTASGKLKRSETRALYESGGLALQASSPGRQRRPKSELDLIQDLAPADDDDV